MAAAATQAPPRRRREGAATRVYIGAVCLLALTLLVVGWQVAGPPNDWFALLVLAVLAILSTFLRENDTGHRVKISITSIVLLASAVIVGPVAGGIIGAISNVPEWRRARAEVRIFNTAMVSIVGSVGGLIYLAAGGSRQPELLQSPGPILLRVGLPLMVADVMQCVVNAVLLAGVTRVAAAVPMRAQIVRLLSTTGYAYIGYGLIGFIFVVLWLPVRVGWFSAVLVLAPLLVARWAFVQYGEELRAHERILNALVTAVETKDRHSAGHSSRVAQLCEWIGEALGLGHKEIQDVRTAGMLHDLGKVSVPSRILRSRHTHTDDELLAVADHALNGVELLQEIAFLRDSLEGIAHHHERYDGKGYPRGLEGEHIPLAARIIAVADAFDALTTTRSYRPAHPVEEAVYEIQRRASTQFDPAVVAALVRATQRHEWSVTELDEDLLATAGSATDHDDPVASDLLAERSDLRQRIRKARSPAAQPEPARRP